MANRHQPSRNTLAFRLNPVEKAEVVANCDNLARLNELERKYDAQFRVVFDAIRALMEPPKPPGRRIGF